MIAKHTSPSTAFALGRAKRQRAFTLVELLTVIAVLALLGTVALAASHRSGQQALLAACADNQRQIGTAMNIYAAEHNDYAPVCRFRSSTAWYTYEAARFLSGTPTLLFGYFNLGLLVQEKALDTPKAVYCPAQSLPAYTYNYYTSYPNLWAPPPTDDNLRTGYSYFPQVRQTESLGLGVVVSKITESNDSYSTLVPVKLGELNPRKSFASDLVHNLFILPHRAGGEVTGVNAVFPDGSVAFQNARTSPEKFNPALWQNIGNDGPKFRRVMDSWEQ